MAWSVQRAVARDVSVSEFPRHVIDLDGEISSQKILTVTTNRLCSAEAQRVRIAPFRWSSYDHHAVGPATAVLYPSSGSVVSGSHQWLDATATSGATGVTFELSGGTLSDSVIASGTLTLYGWLGVFDTRSVPDGNYTLQSVASCPGNMTVTSPASTLVVNNAPPTTTVVYPANAATLHGTLQWLDAMASSGVSSVKYELTGGTLSDSVIASGVLTLYGWLGAFSTTTIPNGTYTLQSVASYAGGVIGTSPGITITISN